MARLSWGTGELPYEAGCDHGVLYLAEGVVPWNGLIEVNEEETSEIESSQYFDGVKFFSTESIGDYKASIKAYTYPEVFAEYDGHSERDIHRRFGFSYRTQRDDGYRIHLVYDTMVTPKGMTWGTATDNPAISTFDWDIYANPVPVLGGMPTAHMILDSDDLNYVTSYIEDILYGTETTDPRLPTPNELVDIFEEATTLRITHHPDGSYTASGPEEILEVFGDGTFKIKAPTVFLSPDGKFQVRSF